MTVTRKADNTGAAEPAMPDELERAIAMMAKIGLCFRPSFSPDGRRMAFVSDLSGTPQVWIVPTKGGWPELITAFDDPVRDVSWSPNGSWLAVSVAPGGGMNAQIYRMRPDGTEVRLLTLDGRDNNWLGPWTHDGSLLSVSSNRRRSDTMDCYLVDAASGDFRLVRENPGIGAITDISQDGRYVVVDRTAHRSDNNLFLVDLLDRRETLLTPHEGPASFRRGQFSLNGRTVYLSSNGDRDLAAFARVVLGDGGEPGPIEVLAEREDAELDSFVVTDDGHTAALLWNVAGRTELALHDLTTLELRPGAQLPVECAVGPVFSRDGRYLAVSATGATAPWDIWVLDRESGELQQMTHSPHPGVDLSALVRPELVRFSAHDGLELSGWLYRPRGFAAPGRVVLSFHGGPEAQERPWFDSSYQALLAQRIAVFAPNVRGSSGFGKRFVNLDNGALRFDAVTDIKACVDRMVNDGIADPARIGIMGGSYGGYMTMDGLTEYPDLFAAGVNLFGIVNFETFFQHTEPWMAAISKIEYGDPETGRDLLRRLSPIHRIDRVTAPVLVLHGANDTNVPVVEAEQVAESLRQRGIRVEYVLFPDEGHGFVKEPNRIRSTVEIVRWFAEHL